MDANIEAIPMAILSSTARQAGLLSALLLIGLALIPSPSAAAATPRGPDPSDEFFKAPSIPRLRIEVPPEGMEILRSYVFHKGSNPDSRTNVHATVREGDRVYTNVALHIKGSLGSSVPVDEKPALTLGFDKWSEGQRFHGLQKISLNNTVQDASYISEIITRELFTAAGLPCPRATHARVELNGRDLGLFVLLEGWNKQFLKRHFKDARGNLWDSGSAGDITEDLDTNSGAVPGDRDILDALIAATREKDITNRLAKLDRVLDLDRFLTFMAMEVMLAHWDGYCLNKNNYRVFHDLSTGRIIFLPHGMDQMFGNYRMSPTSSITPMMKGVAAAGVAQTTEGRRRYLERMSQLATSLFDVARLTNHVNELAARVQPALGDDPNVRARHQAAVDALNTRIARRGASVREQLLTAAVPLAFSPDREAKLGDWRVSLDSGRPTFRKLTSPKPTMEVTASGPRAYGSWRTTVFLDAGDYQLTGKVKLLDAQYSQSVTNGGATLRISGEREAKMITEAADWTTVNYDFTVVGQIDVEFVCEFRASQGRAIFDASTIKLIRKTLPAAALK